MSGVDVGVTALHRAATWTDRAYQATTHRNGRVLIAGDAAHIHSPLGGQGLNLGLGDAMNLGWKIAAAIDSQDPALLNSYAEERHPVGAQILDWSRAQAALMRPSPGTRALAAIIRDLVETGDGATYFAERVWGLSLRYELGGDHPLIGRSVPDFSLANGQRTGELLRSGRGLLLEFGVLSLLGAVPRQWNDRITHLLCEADDSLGLSAVLIRPDGIVAWATDATPDTDEFARAARRWFGGPAGPI